MFRWDINKETRTTKKGRNTFRKRKKEQNITILSCNPSKKFNKEHNSVQYKGPITYKHQNQRKYTIYSKAPDNKMQNNSTTHRSHETIIITQYIIIKPPPPTNRQNIRLI